MAQFIGVWGRRFIRLKNKGYTDKQVEDIINLLGEVSAFRFHHIEVSARKQWDAIKEGNA